ncbi:MAG: hypothetical protein H7Z14_15570 [Anaerolineae bacterium]|nr:hypothetical protein [Phycisphaerae bacterium]
MIASQGKRKTAQTKTARQKPGGLISHKSKTRRDHRPAKELVVVVVVLVRELIISNPNIRTVVRMVNMIGKTVGENQKLCHEGTKGTKEL